MTDSRGAPEFELLETMRWTPGEGFFLLERHLRRMQASARRFGYAWNEERVRRALDHAVAGSAGARRVRLLAARDGGVRVECNALEPVTRPARLGIATRPVDPANVFLSNKTTHRVMYADAAQPDCDDVILWTAGGDVTETTLGNLVVEIGGRKVTPPASSGMLAGTFRAELIERGDLVEARVTLDDVKTASRVWIVNSVREWWPAEIHIANQAATAPTTTSSPNPGAEKRTQR